MVDGYNVLFRLADEAVISGGGRERLAAALRRLHRQSSGRHPVIVVYDSSLGGERSSSRSGGLEVRFAAQDRLADDEIAEIAADASGRVVVVSSDREVRDRATAVGAVALWSETLLPLLRG